MKLWSKLLASVLLALWLPATLHCDLEAAGIDFLTHEDHGASLCRDSCIEDACHSIEGSTFTKELGTLKVLPPDALGAVFLLFSPPLTVEQPSPPRPREGSSVWLVLHRTWSFVLRTALPARAPESVV